MSLTQRAASRSKPKLQPIVSNRIQEVSGPEQSNTAVTDWDVVMDVTPKLMTGLEGKGMLEFEGT